MPRPGRPRKYPDPGAVWVRRERLWNETRGERKQAILASLRAAFAGGERGLAGWPAICAWLNAHHFRNREGGLVTAHVAKGWRQRLDMPVLRGRPGQTRRWGGSLPWTTTYLLLAWAASLYRSGGPEMPRIIIDSSSAA
jgi:hypothetical protein